MKKKDCVEAKMIMEEPIGRIEEGQTLRDAAEAFSCNPTDRIHVTDEQGKFVGIIEARQILECIYRETEMDMPIQQLIKKDVNRVDREAVLDVNLLSPQDDIYVCSDGCLAGVITPANLINLYHWTIKLTKKFETKCKEYELIFNNIYDSIYDIDGNGVVLMANPATQRITGKIPEDVIGKKIEEIEAERIFFPSVVHKVKERGETVTILQNVRKDKKAVVTGVPVFDANGDLCHIIATTRDVGLLIENLDEWITQDLQKALDGLKKSEDLAERYFTQIRQLQSEQEEEKRISTNNKEMQSILDMVKRIAPVDSSILILGESGVGKDLLANMVHNMSGRRNGPFVKINCGAIPENILESELFGYEQGAFTGAQKNGKLGLLEIGNGGTVFLNEIGELPQNLQVKLLQAIQDKSFIRLGGAEPICVDIRIISATNRDLYQMVKQNTFREDLFYRLNVIPVTIPPLRKRREDIPDLIMTFIDRFNTKYSRKKQLSSSAMELLLNYDWPGNVRELENMIERIVVVSGGDIIYPTDFPTEIHSSKKEEKGAFYYREDEALDTIMERLEKEVLCRAYRTFGTTTKMAEALRANQSTIARKLRRYKITKK